VGLFSPMCGVPVSDGAEAVAITQRELLMELREDVRRLSAVVADMAAEQGRLADSIRSEQELGIERRNTMRRAADALSVRVDDHAIRIDTLERHRDRQDGAMVFAKAAFGTSAVALAAVVLQILTTLKVIG
jgi:hypothetical protein